MDVDFGFGINWVSVPIFLALAFAVAAYASREAGGWTRPWIGIKPVWWFVLLFLLPWVGLPVLGVSLWVHRHARRANTGTTAPD